MLPPEERISERIVEQIVDFSVVGGLQDCRPGQSSSSVARSPADWLNTEDEPFQGCIRTFSPESSPSTPAAHVDALSVVELLAKFQQLSDHVGDLERRSPHAAQEVSSDIDWLYRLITEARHRLQQLEAWAQEVTGDDGGPR